MSLPTPDTRYRAGMKSANPTPYGRVDVEVDHCRFGARTRGAESDT
jgi:hypothetical protein